MPFVKEDLVPYVSLTLFEVVDKSQSLPGLVAKILKDVDELVNGQSGWQLVSSSSDSQANWVIVGFAHFVVTERPSWLSEVSSSNNSITDTRNELFLVVHRGPYLAMYSSRPALLDLIVADLGHSGRQSLVHLRKISRDRLQSAFVSGDAKTMWLSGIHRRSSFRADSKILAGSRLQDALDPLADQSFFYSAIRMQTPLAENLSPISIGVNPGTSRVWTKKIATWSKFLEETQSILAQLTIAEALVFRPLPFLASPVSTLDGIKNAFDISIISPQILLGTLEVDSWLAHLSERWAERSRWGMITSQDASLVAEVTVDEVTLGEIELSPQIDSEGLVTWLVRWGAIPDLARRREILEIRTELESICTNRSSWLTVRYESGHAISNKRAFSLRFRDVDFNGWVWKSFTGFHVAKEKPLSYRTTSGGKKVAELDLNRIGSAGSLFCWIVDNWTRSFNNIWLTCDDGPGEIADFVAHDENSQKLWLIHAKGASSESTHREISTSAYEVVVGQAVKNLRHLDWRGATQALEDGINGNAAQYTWRGSSRANRSDMIQAIASGGIREREVAIVQPHITKSEYDSASSERVNNQVSGRVKRLRQLTTLLVSAENSCAAMNAAFKIYGDEG